jgi:hypothetical protein
MLEFFGLRCVRATRSLALCAIAAVLLSGCGFKTPSGKATVQITDVPPADPGGLVQMAFV